MKIRPYCTVRYFWNRVCMAEVKLPETRRNQNSNSIAATYGTTKLELYHWEVCKIQIFLIVHMCQTKAHMDTE